MSNPYRAMCAELIELCTPVDSIPQLAERLQKLNALADRARALLAQPVAEGPNDEEIISQADKFLAYSDAHMGDPARWEGSDVDLVAFTRHAIDRWGRPTPQPVAVSERRPKLPSLRKQAYDALDTYIYGEPDPKDKERTYNTIRKALEALPND